MGYRGVEGVVKTLLMVENAQSPKTFTQSVLRNCADYRQQTCAQDSETFRANYVCSKRLLLDDFKLKHSIYFTTDDFLIGMDSDLGQTMPAI